MAYTSVVKLVTNTNPKLTPQSNHTLSISKLFKGATHLDCLVAFANTKGLDEICEPLINALDKGMCARFVVGLDFFQTEPDALEWLLELAEEDYPDQVQLFISSESRERTFHPKAYVFQYRKKYGKGPCKAVVGSANMTLGGFSNNHEFSVYLEEAEAEFAKAVDAEISRMLAETEVITATQELIDEYARQHAIYALHTKLALKKAKASISRKLAPSGGLYLGDLQAILALMKMDAPHDEFSKQQALRKSARVFAKTQMDSIRTKPMNTPQDFLAYYAPLVARGGKGWQSGNLNRRKATVAMSCLAFQAALQVIEAFFQHNPKASVEQFYGRLRSRLVSVKHVGPNIITEILHTYDNTRFAIMNKNSVSGLAMANITELDALFNFAYWRY
jgi:HKD family nuclease